MTESIDAVLQSAVDAGAVPNVVAVAADRNGVIYEGAAGPVAAGGTEMVGPDTTYRIASMTKMIGTVAALQLVERGALDLTAPVENYLPEFASLQVLDGFDGDTPRLRPPASKATVHQLVTHTTGLGYYFFSADLGRWEQLTGTPNVLSGSKAALTAPMIADPGTRFEYGINTDWLGQVVEAVSGEPLDKFLDANILGPLGMDSATFLMSPEQRATSTPIHFRGEDGAWAASGFDLAQNPEYWTAGHGLHCTPRDYLKFQRMLLGGGTLDGVRILEPASVDAAFTDQIAPLTFPEFIASADPVATCDFGAGPGWTWGHGLLLNTFDLPGMRAAYSGAWAGLFNTHFWVDRTTGVTGSIFSQFLPFVTPEAFGMYMAYEQALYASLT